MSDVIIVALIGAAASIIGSVVSMFVSAKKSAQQTGLTIYRIDQLESKVNKHNEIIERTYLLEKKAALYEEKMRVANHRIDDLERGGHHHEDGH